ncbi:hypothetical protein BDZ94DRAFT_1253388 [Collybia nuda]|uniref:Uncharacterized protein n=1 Tax=Collybia nuda TaxID=64659 RepID=A0A9P6CM40_9AGAR|nr:hypothetical protein BDZ94DRAFT_1253388 [Collybia nuda]
MKFSSTLALSALLSTTAFAQRIAIGYPANGTSVQPGSSFLMEVDRPNSLSGSTEVAVVIGFQSCAASPCHSPADGLGTVLYNGGYKPVFQTGAASKPPHQNFTVTIPTTAPKGSALIGVSHMALIGAGQAAFLESVGVEVNVV